MLKKLLICCIVVSGFLAQTAQANGCLAIHVGALISTHEQSGDAAQQIVDTQTYQDPDCGLGNVAVSRCVLVHVSENGAKQTCKSIISQGATTSSSAFIPDLPNISKSVVKTYEIKLPDMSITNQ